MAERDEVLLQEAIRLYGSGHMEESEALFRQLAKESTASRADAYYGLGLVQLKRGSGAAAKTCFESALQHDQQHQNALFRLGELALGRGAAQDARNYFEKVLALNPGHQAAREHLRRLSDERNKYTVSSNQWERQRPLGGPTIPKAGYAEERQDESSFPFGGSGVRSGTVRGRATNVPSRFQMWSDPLGRSMATFRVVPEDGATPIEVEMRGRAFLGSLVEGDTVEVTGAWRGNTLRAKRLRNLKTSATFEARSYFWFYIGAQVVVAIVGLLVFLYFSERDRERFGLDREPPAITLFPVAGGPGTSVTVSGMNFDPGETIRIDFHAQEVGKTQADDKGAFAGVVVRIPPDWRVKGQFDIVVRGEKSIRSTREPFQVT